MGGYETEQNLKATELRLGLPGSEDHVFRSNKRSSPESSVEESMSKSNVDSSGSNDAPSADHDDNVQPAK